MIRQAVFGTVFMKIDGFDVSLLTERLYKSCKVISLYEKSGSVYFKTFGIYEKKAAEIADKNNCVYEILERKGIRYTLQKYVKRYGLYAGAALAAAAIFFLSNTVMKIEINGALSDETRAEVREILKEEGLKAGAYIPSLNYFNLANRLFSSSDKIAWASIGNVGSVVEVNITEATRPEEVGSSRIPCNIVSTRDAVITDAKVLAGQLEVLIGDAVYKGKLLVSGIVPLSNGSAQYCRSIAEITGRYEQSVDFRVNYIEEGNFEGEKIYRRALNFFELEIPLPGGIFKTGAKYSEAVSKTDLKLLGLKLPIAVTTYEYTELISDIKSYSTEEALAELYRRLENYEKNILRGVEIVDRRTQELRDGEGVTLRADYVLEGEIGKISDIYIK